MRARTTLVAVALTLGASSSFSDVTVEEIVEEQFIIHTLLQHIQASHSDKDPALTDVRFGHLTHDDNLDAILTYVPPMDSTGGNFYTQRLAVFVSKGGVFKRVQDVQVGAKGKRFLYPISIEFGEIEFEVRFWQESDAACCPSGRSTTTIRFIQGMLEEA